MNNAVAGATPKLTTSANESSSLPRGENVFRILAAIPSRKSKRAAMATQITTPSKLLLKAIVIAIQPENRFRSVKIFGTCFLICSH
jgi:hypothetical protein